MFQYLKDAGYGFLIGGFHVKGQVDRYQGRGGLGLRRADDRARRLDRTASPRRSPPIRSTPGRSRPCSASTSCPAPRKHDPLAYLQNRTVDWLDHQLAARELLQLDVANTHLVVEHEYPRARIQDKERLKPILQGSLAFARKIDEAAACMYALQHEVLPAQEIPVQGRGRVALLDLSARTANGEDEAERRDDRLRLHGPRALERLAAGRRDSSDRRTSRCSRWSCGRTEAKVKEAAGRWAWRSTRPAGKTWSRARTSTSSTSARPATRTCRSRSPPPRRGRRSSARSRSPTPLAEAERMLAAVKNGRRRPHALPQLPPRARRWRWPSSSSTRASIGDIHHYRGALPAGLDRRSRVPARLAAGEGAGRVGRRSATSCRTRWICRATWSASRSRSRRC